MTERLYYQDAYCREFEAQVISCLPESGSSLVCIRFTISFRRSVAFMSSPFLNCMKIFQ